MLERLHNNMPNPDLEEINKTQTTHSNVALTYNNQGNKQNKRKIQRTLKTYKHTQR